MTRAETALSVNELYRGLQSDRHGKAVLGALRDVVWSRHYAVDMMPQPRRSPATNPRAHHVVCVAGHVGLGAWHAHQHLAVAHEAFVTKAQHRGQPPCLSSARRAASTNETHDSSHAGCC